MPYKLQQSEPELMCLADKSKEPLVRCGIDDPNQAGYARNCLQTRRLLDRGLLDDTIVILEGEFGRAPMVQGETMSATITARTFSIRLASGEIAWMPRAVAAVRQNSRRLRSGVVIQQNSLEMKMFSSKKSWSYGKRTADGAE
jgi:hypothetical protein